MGRPYRAKPDGARPPEGHVLRDTRMGRPYRAKLDVARPPDGHALRDTRIDRNFFTGSGNVSARQDQYKRTPTELQ